MALNELIMRSIQSRASDLHLSSGYRPMMRVDGALKAFGDEILNHQQLMSWLQPTLTVSQSEQLARDGELDYALMLDDNVRLRGNLFQQRQGISAAFRHIPTRIPDMDELDAPTALTALLHQRDGIILVTGATGSGKSTTLAALVGELNRTVAQHILTMEDPIEFIHTSRRSLIQQREIGPHSASFMTALRAALREDPDIILLGELRDPATIRLALTAAETGHLVLASLHTRSAIQTIERLVDVFPAEEKAFVRAQLASSLRGVIAQKLLPRKEGGRIAVFEVLLGTPAVSSLIREGKTHQLLSVLQTSKHLGMQSMEQGILARAAQELITEEDKLNAIAAL